jgi:hypothetical protein
MTALRTAGERALGRASDFALPALLDVIEQCFDGASVRFCSSGERATQRTLVTRAWLDGDTVWVELSIGLSSPTSTLPSRLLAALDDPRADPLFRDLVALVDDSLLRAEAYSFRPERAWRSSDELVALRRAMFRAAPVASPASVHYLFRAVFPELNVSVERAKLPTTVTVRQARLDYAVLDQDALGEASLGYADGLDVWLTGTAACWVPRRWSVECPERFLASIAPALRGSHLRLRARVDCEAPLPELTLDAPVGHGSASLGGATRASLVLFDDILV